MRGTLQRVLHEGLIKNHGPMVNFGRRLSGISYASTLTSTSRSDEEEMEGIMCEFEDGSTAGPYDLVVGCDGINSAVRRYVNDGKIRRSSSPEGEEEEEGGGKGGGGASSSAMSVVLRHERRPPPYIPDCASPSPFGTAMATTRATKRASSRHALLLTGITSGLVRGYFGESSRCWGVLASSPNEGILKEWR